MKYFMAQIVKYINDTINCMWFITHRTTPQSTLVAYTRRACTAVHTQLLRMSVALVRPPLSVPSPCCTPLCPSTMATPIPLSWGRGGWRGRTHLQGVELLGDFFSPPTVHKFMEMERCSVDKKGTELVDNTSSWKCRDAMKTKSGRDMGLLQGFW